MTGTQKVVTTSPKGTCFTAEDLVGGDIIYHKPTKGFYQTQLHCSIKTAEHKWVWGWSYVKVRDLFGDQKAFEVNCDPETFRMFVRPDSLFDSDWILIRAGTKL